MLALAEIALCFLVMPLFAALVAKTGVAGRIGWFIGTAFVTVMASSLAVDSLRPIGSLLAIVCSGLVMIGIAASCGRSCPQCKRRVHFNAQQCPYCQNVIATEAVGYRKCPDCAESIRADARKCRFCGLVLPEHPRPPASPVIAPDSAVWVDIYGGPPSLSFAPLVTAPDVAAELPPVGFTPKERSWISWIIGILSIVLAAALIGAMALTHKDTAVPERAPFGRTDEPASLRSPAKSNDAELIERGCRAAKILYSSKPMSELTVGQMSVIRSCKAIGEW